jgi:hypothetical protein
MNARILRGSYRNSHAMSGLSSMESPTAKLSQPEKRMALIHRVIVSDEEYPKEYAILATDRRSVFIHQEKTRSRWVLRQEMRFGTALVTDVAPKTLEDYGEISLETLAADPENKIIPHQNIVSLEMRVDPPERRRRDFFVWWVMKRQNEIFQVYNFVMKYRIGQEDEKVIKFYAVPLGVYFKPRRMTQARETILREYGADILDTYRTVLPASTISSEGQMIRSLTRPELVAWAKRLC